MEFHLPNSALGLEGVRSCWLAQGPDPGEMGGAFPWPKGESPFPQSSERGRRSGVFTAEEAGVALGRDLWSEGPSPYAWVASRGVELW